MPPIFDESENNIGKAVLGPRMALRRATARRGPAKSVSHRARWPRSRSPRCEERGRSGYRFERLGADRDPDHALKPLGLLWPDQRLSMHASPSSRIRTGGQFSCSKHRDGKCPRTRVTPSLTAMGKDERINFCVRLCPSRVGQVHGSSLREDGHLQATLTKPLARPSRELSRWDRDSDREDDPCLIPFATASRWRSGIAKASSPSLLSNDRRAVAASLPRAVSWFEIPLGLHHPVGESRNGFRVWRTHGMRLTRTCP